MFCHQLSSFNVANIPEENGKIYDIETGEALTVDSTASYRVSADRQIINAAIKFCSHYKGLRDAKAHFISKLNEYRKKCTTAATSSSQMLAFYQSCCHMRLNNSNHGSSATSGTTHYFAMSGNDGILSPHCSANGNYIVTRPLECVPSCTIMTEAQFLDPAVSLPHVSASYNNGQGFRIVRRNANGSIAYNADGTFAHDYNVGIYIYKGRSADGVFTASTYSELDAAGKRYVRWLASKLPYVFDTIEDATGLEPGHPVLDPNTTVVRKLLLNMDSAEDVGVQDGANYTLDTFRVLCFTAGTDEQYNPATYKTFDATNWCFVDQTNSTTINRDANLLASARGSSNGSQTRADILQHEMLHFVMFMNYPWSTHYLYLWFKEGFADLIRSNTATRWDHHSNTNQYGGLWGELFHGITWKGIKFSFDNLLCVDDYTSALVELGGASGGTDSNGVKLERHINYAAGYAFFKFLFWSVVNGWDQEWRHSQDSSFKIDTLKAI